MDASTSLSNRRRSCWGVYESTLREDASVQFPERFRVCLGEEVVMVRLPCHAIGVLPLDLLEEGAAALVSDDSVYERSASAMRFMLATAESGHFDSKGRLAFTPAHCEWAALTPETPLRIVGVGDKVEIWSRAEWEAYQAGATYNDDTREAY
ncbi:MAG: hypothetical protein JWN14_1627 [Chthonomonadales bacterium]|nr:hypothetical protein [Chthonomonadales bacterium]